MPNPEGVNNFDHFAQEPAYGEATQQQGLAAGAPMAGQQVVSGPLNMPKRAQRNAVAQRAHGQGGIPPQAQISPQASVAAFWKMAATIPGVSDLVKEIAANA